MPLRSTIANTVIIPSGVDLVSEVLSHLKGDALTLHAETTSTGRDTILGSSDAAQQKTDYSSSLVVFPGKRPAHFLRKRLAAEIGGSYIPPMILSINEFVDWACDKLNSGSEDTALQKSMETIDAVAILYEIHKSDPKPLGGKGFMTPDSFFPLGLKIYKDIEELTMAGVKPHFVKDIESFVVEGIPEYTRERFQSLTYFYEEFYRKAASMRLTTRSMRYRMAANRIGEVGFESYERAIFAGFYAATVAERELFRKILSYENSTLIFQDGAGLKDQLKALGIDYEPPADDLKPESEPQVHFYSSPDSHGQVMALGSILNSIVESGETLDDRSIVVLPTADSLFALTRQGLSVLAEDAYNVSLGYPLTRTPVFGFVGNLIDMINSMDGDKIYIPDYLKFVLHPYVKNIYFKGKSEITRILFHGIEDELLRQKARTFITLSELEGQDVLLKNVYSRFPKDLEGIMYDSIRDHLKSIHENTIGRFLAFDNTADFAQKAIGLLMYIYNHSTAKRHPLFSPFAESFIASLESLLKSLIKDIAFAERSSYFTFFRKYIQTCLVPFSGTPVKGLQVLGSLEMRNIKFDRVFVLDANEGVLPNTGSDDTLLPFKARQVLGLSTYLDSDKLESYYFDLLLKGASEVHLFFIENDQSERSRFVEKILWEKQKKDGILDSRYYIRPVQYKVNLVNNTPGAIGKLPEMVSFLKEYEYSATTLNQYLKCPLQFYHDIVLGLSRKDTVTGSIERDDLGNFVHSVLKVYFSSRKGRNLTEADIDQKHMDSIVDEQFALKYGTDPSGALYLFKRQISRHMADLLQHYYLPLVKSKVVMVLEVEELIKVKIGSFNLKGRLDSVEQRNGRTTIIDFKTGANPNYLRISIDSLDLAQRATWPAVIGSLQLPFYTMLYVEKNKMDIKAVNAMFLLLGQSRISSDIELPLFYGPSSEDAYAKLKSVIIEILKEIVDPEKPFEPASDRKKACPGCDYQYMCGTQWIVK